MNTDVVFAAICTIAVLVMAIYYITRKNKVRSVLFGSFTGISALLILNRWGSCFNSELPLNVFNVSGSAVLGVPFVIMLVILKIL